MYIYACVCVCVYCHIFFIHSSVDGHLGSFYSLAIVDIVDIAAINMWVHMPLHITNLHLWGKYPE